MKISSFRSRVAAIGRLASLTLAAFGLLACSSRAKEPTESAAATHVERLVSCSSGGAGGAGGAGGGASTADTAPGALIVDLGTSPQTPSNALKPYGMVYDLVKNAKVPVLWAYDTNKASNSATDFTVDGRSFSGSSFVIPGAFVATAQATINKWTAQGVVLYGPTKAAFTPPTYFKRITGFPNIVLDPQNGAVAQGYLTAAGFPIFPVQYPATLNSCQDMFVLPHADPTWALHGNLKSFVTNGGFLWVGCHAVSVLESVDGNADGVPDLDFLSTTGLINYANHSGGTPPYSYSVSSLADPVMQFLGGVNSALSGGSEQVYLPFLGGAWRPTTKISVWDPDQVDVVAGRSPGLGVKIAYGRGYGLPNAGQVMYEGSHNFAGSSADQIAAQRAFLNFVLWNASEKSVVVAATAPTRMLGATQVSLTSTASSSGSISTYQWTSSCGGSFGTPTAANTTFTAPAAAVQNTPCVLRLTATDSCGRVAFDARDSIVLGLPDLAVTIVPSATNPTVGSALNYTITANDVGGLPTVSSVVTFTLPPASQYNVTSVVATPAGIVCTARAAPNANVYDCPVGDLDGCNPVTILVKGTVVANGCFSVGVNGTTASNDVDLASNNAGAQTCSLSPGDGAILFKSVSPAAPTTANPGGTLTYTLTMFNGGSTQLDNIHIYDPYPTGTTTYVPASVSVTYQQYVSTVADSFAANTYSGSAGILPWAGPWTEISDGGGRATTGSIRVKTTNCASSSCPNMTAKFDNAGIQRPLSLSSATAATLSFTYRVPTNKAGQNALVQASGDGGATFRTMATLSLATKIATSTPVSVAFQPSELTANARIRFITTGNSSALFVPDDIVIQLQTAGSAVTSLGSAPTLANSYDLTENLNGLLSLKPGASISATFRTTVNVGVVGGTSIANTANVKTTQTGATAINSNTVTVFTAAVATKAPTAVNQILSFSEDVALGSLGISAPSDADTASGSLSVRVQQLPLNSQAAIYLADGVTPISIGQVLSVAQLTNLKVTGALDFNGSSEPFMYAVSDPEGNSASASASMAFSAVNDAPVAYPDSDVTQKGIAVVLDPPGANDTDVDGSIDDALCDLDPLTAGVQSSFSNGAGTWVVDTSAASATFGSVTYTPAAGFTGVATLSYASSDDGTPLPAKASAAGTNCAVSPAGACLSVRVNAPPAAVLDNFSVTTIGGSKDVTVNDTDGDGILDVTAIDLDTVTSGIQTSFTVAGKGTFSSLLTGQVRFVPVSGFIGAATANYTIDDFDGGTSASAAINVTVSGCVSAVECDDGSTCTTDTCSAGVCSNTKLSVGASCNDQNSATKNDVCDAAGACSGTVYSCTPSACESASVPNGTGCLGTPIADGTSCSDGNACTQTDSCQSGVCTGVNPVSCGPTAECHVTATCEPATGLCVSPAVADGTSCSDGNACTQTDTCQSGACTGQNPVTCAAADQCHAAGTCAPATGTCSSPPVADGTTCNDGNACTQIDSCQAGTCAGANPVLCVAADQCHAPGTCAPATGVCSSPPAANGTACNDGNACTQTDSCQSGTCAGANPVTCAAADQCHTAGTCAPATGVCSSPVKANGSACSDGNACTQTDTCQAGACTGVNPVTCAAADQCHSAGTCAPDTGVCSSPPVANGTACNDGNACTQTDSCQGGTCAGANPVTCTAADQCHTAGTCSPATGVCSSPVKANGSACSDGDACTQTDTCQSGSCAGANPVSCTAADQCHTAGTCDPGTGVCSSPAKAEGATCDDGNGCTQTDTCQAGTCAGNDPITCAAADQCHAAGTCSPATGVCSSPPVADGTACNDANACTQSDSCQSGACAGANPITCTAADQCHAAGTCDPGTGVCSSPAKADGSACDDADACTQTDSCLSGACTGTNPLTCPALDQCHVPGTCAPSTGVCSTPAKADGAACNDGNACTQTDSCQSGACLGQSPVICAAANQCHTVGTCSPATGVCSSPVKPDGSSCSDGDGCTQSDSCQSGACSAGPPVVCASPDKPTCSSPSGACGCNSNAECLGTAPVCELASHTCFGCLVDTDCSASQFCNTESRSCTGKIPNGFPVPTIGGHSPALTGLCSLPVGSAVCVSEVCDTTDQDCGYPNAVGPCTTANAALRCRSGICDATDTKCGYANGNGPCDDSNAGIVCRSGACSVSHVCQAPSACTVDGDCAATQFCHTEQHSCVAKLPNGTLVPTIVGHDPILSGSCTAPVGSAVCLSAVCDQADQLCGYANGTGACTVDAAAVLCRSGACDQSDGKCGYENGHGPCSASNAGIVCRSGACSVSGVCQAQGTCTVDGDCASTQYCDSQAHQCTAKLPNATPIPILSGHLPPLTGTCSAAVATAVCNSAVCDTRDDACGYANGQGPCSGGSASVVCRSNICDSSDGKCGYENGHGPCSELNATIACRSGACSVSGVCQAAGACTVDGDCASTQFCNTALAQCTPKLANGAAVPVIAEHSPELTGLCSAPVAAAVCVSQVCDVLDNRCGYENGHGQCTRDDAIKLCRSGSCDEADNHCGYADGHGPCTMDSVCRSLSCSVSLVCQAKGTCTVDGDCSASQFCDTEAHACVSKLKNGAPLPTISDHTPALTGTCSEPVSLAVCQSAVCDDADDACGYLNDHGPCMVSNEAIACRSSVCDASDAKCGYADGHGPCTVQNAATTCRSGACSEAGLCQQPEQCRKDADCAATQFCNTETHLCVAKLSNGRAVPSISGHSPPLTGECSRDVGQAICVSAVCDEGDDRCGYADGTGPCTAADATRNCRSGQCSAATGLCKPVAGCLADADCAAGNFCNTETMRCTAQLPNESPIPTIAGHSPALTGLCSEEVASAVCLSSVCDATDNLCGLADGSGPCTSANVEACRSGTCHEGLCGKPDPVPVVPPVAERALQGGGCACTFTSGDTGSTSRWGAVLLTILLGVWRRRRTVPTRPATRGRRQEHGTHV